MPEMDLSLRAVAAQVVFHAERGLEWVALAQKHQHALATALFTWSCATVTVGFYATFLPALICAPCRLLNALCSLCDERNKTTVRTICSIRNRFFHAALHLVGAGYSIFGGMRCTGTQTIVHRVICSSEEAKHATQGRASRSWAGGSCSSWRGAFTSATR